MMTTRRRLAFRLTTILLLSLVVTAMAVAVKGCASPPSFANRNPAGEPLPRVTGANLEGVPVTLPDDLAGAPAVLLVGYVQGTQFDIDRWLMGLLQAEVDARIVELPTIPGLVASFASGWIDDGMRAGIPREDWPSVITLYGEAAAPIAALTGTEFPRRARVLLLDASGRIVWFDDEGYGAAKALEVARRIRGLSAE